MAPTSCFVTATVCAASRRETIASLSKVIVRQATPKDEARIASECADQGIPLVEKLGGKHHGYLMPSEGTNNLALALFTFPSLAAYEVYRAKAAQDPDCQAAMRYYEETKMLPEF
jgi:NIPSNAP